MEPNATPGTSLSPSQDVADSADVFHVEEVREDEHGALIFFSPPRPKKRAQSIRPERSRTALRTPTASCPGAFLPWRLPASP